MRPWSHFLKEATRRRIFNVAALYVVGAWVTLQIADLALSGLGIDDSAIRYVWTAAALGFPIAILFGWRFDLVAGRIVRTSDSDSATPQDQALHRSDYIFLSVLATAALVITTVLAAQLHRSRSITIDTVAGTVGEPEFVAVLPFVNLSADDANQYFTDGLTEELVNTLSRLEGLEVASRTSSFAFRESKLDARVIARRLGVGTLLEGSVRRIGQRVRVSAQLIDGKRGFEIWSETYVRELVDIFAIQEDISRSVAGGLKLALSDDSFGVRPTESVEAYDYYLQGLGHLRRPPTQGDLSIAIGFFQKSIALDADYAAAYAGICEAHLGEYLLLGAPRLVDEARLQCDRALALDKQMLEVHIALGQLSRHSGDFDNAVSEFNAALAIDSDSSEALTGLAATYESAGDLDLAEQKYREAIRLKPGNWTGHMAYGQFLYWQGRFEEAGTEFERVVVLSPDNAHAFSFLGGVHLYSNRPDEALEALQTSIRISPRRAAYRDLGLHYYYRHQFSQAVTAYRKALEFGRDDHWSWGSLGQSARYVDGESETSRVAFENAAEAANAVLKVNDKDWRALGKLAMYNAYLGNNKEAGRQIGQAVEHGAHIPEVWYFASHTYLRLGRHNDALDAMSRAIEDGFPVILISLDPEFESLHDNDRYNNLVASTGR